MVDYKPGKNQSIAKVDGRRPNEISDMVDLVDGDLEQIDGEGTQSGSHPAKSQPKTMRYIG